MTDRNDVDEPVEIEISIKWLASRLLTALLVGLCWGLATGLILDAVSPGRSLLYHVAVQWSATVVGMLVYAYWRGRHDFGRKKGTSE